jgi:hypothetical protein
MIVTTIVIFIPWSGVPEADGRSASYKFVDSEKSLPYSLYPVTGLRHQLLESTVYTAVSTAPSVTVCKHVHISQIISDSRRPNWRASSAKIFQLRTDHMFGVDKQMFS